MGFFKRLRNILFGAPKPEPIPVGRSRKTTPTKERRPSTTALPDDARVTIERTWKRDKGYKDAPWDGKWKDDDIIDADQVIVHVQGDGLDYHRTIHGPFANDAVDNVIDLVEAEFWNPSP